MKKKAKACLRHRPVIEWVGGRALMPMYVDGDDKPYRPEALFWMGSDGAILGSCMAEPGGLLPLACRSLLDTTKRPMVGRPHAPTRLRVACAELAEVLAQGPPKIEVVCAPTPELDEMLAQMREHFAQADDAEASYLGPSMTPEMIASFFDAYAALFRLQPWQLVPDDECLISVTIDQFELHDAVLTVIGQMGESFGLVLFYEFCDFLDYIASIDALERGDEPEVPPHFSVDYERGADIAPALRKEIDQYRWEVATPAAYPNIRVMEEELAVRPANAKEVFMAEVIARALVLFLAEIDALRAAWDGGEALSRTFRVSTYRGEVEVTLRVPHADITADMLVTQDLMKALAELSRPGEEIDSDALQALEEELMERFAASDEARKLTDIGACRLIMDLASGILGLTIASLEARELRFLIFDCIPRADAIDASKAREIIEQTRAYYRFLRREFALEQADACLRVLGGSAVKKLEARLTP